MMTETLSNAAASIAATLAAVGWFVGLRPDVDDKDTAQCHEFILDAVSNADAMRTIECITERDVREQLTVEQAIALHEEAQLSKMSRRN